MLCLGCVIVALGAARCVHSVVITEAEAETIVNGTVVNNPSSAYPFFALPSKAQGDSTWLGCGASIISQKFGLSSAHCFGGGLQPCSGPNKFDLWVGDIEIVGNKIVSVVGGKSSRVGAELICSSNFNGKCSNGHDVAVIKLLDPLPTWVKPAKLNLAGTGKDGVGNSVTIIGYGMTESKSNPQILVDTPRSRLVKASVMIQSDQTAHCQGVYKGGYGCSDAHSEGQATNIDQQFCAAAVSEPLTDSCPGDSGSPVLDASGMQIGLVSYGGGPGEQTSGPYRMCGNPVWPGIYARVGSDGLRAFICEKTDLHCSSSTATSIAQAAGTLQTMPSNASKRQAPQLVRRGSSVSINKV